MAKSTPQQTHIDWAKLARDWKQMRGEVRKRWGLLTDDDLEQIKGQRDILIGRVQHRYGVSTESAVAQVDGWAESLKL
jgi:uncharacterized protein YjbJ (UPF0337 family)